MSESLRQKAASDFAGFCEHCVKIQDKDGKTVPFKLNAPQRYILDKMLKMDADGLPIRIIVLKGRQIGMSTFSQAWLAHKAFTHEGQNCLTIGQNLDMASTLFHKVEYMKKRFPSWLGISDKNTSQTTGRRIRVSDPCNSLLYVETAENKDAGRSLQMRHVQATELPFWPDPARTLAGALQSVPNKQGTSVILESTAHGAGDYFHDTWQKAKLGKKHKDWNGYVPIFIPWHWMDEYRREWREGERGFDKYELELQEKFGLEDEQLLFYRDKKAELGELVKQEYPFDDEEAFQYSGRPFFNPLSMLERVEEEQIKDPILRGEFKIEGGRPVLRDTGHGDLWLWEKPRPGEVYTITVDPSSGAGKDSSGLHILRGLKVIGSYRGKLAMDALASRVHWLATLYNGAMVIPDATGMGLGMMMYLVDELGYRNVYKRQRSFSKDGESQSDEFGFVFSGHSRRAVLGRMLSVVKSGDLHIPCSRTLEEMHTFVYPDGNDDKPQAQSGSHDDMVMSLAMAMAVYEPGATGEIDFYTVKRPIRVSKKTGY